MTFSGDSIRSDHECDSNVARSDHECVSNLTTEFTESIGGECGNGILDRITSEGQGRVTSEGECRIIV